MKRIANVCAALLLFPPLTFAADSDKAKNSYLNKVNQELQEWNVKVDNLQKRSEKAGARTRAQFEEALGVARQDLAVSRQKVTEIEGSGQDNWKKLRRGVDETLKNVKHAYREATSFLEKDKSKEKS